MFAQNILLVGGVGGGGNSIISTQTFDLSTVPTTQAYPANYSVGAKLVLAVSSRTDGGVNSWSFSDALGNTWTRVLEQTQSNGLTVSGIFTCTVTNEITTSDLITIGTTGDRSEDFVAAFYQLSSNTVEDSGSYQDTGPAVIALTHPAGAVVVMAHGAGLGANIDISSTTLDIDVDNDGPRSNGWLLSKETVVSNLSAEVTDGATSNRQAVAVAFYG